MVARIVGSWDETEAARIYASEIVTALSPEELQEALDYYSTEKGRNTYNAIAKGQAKMNAYISGRLAESMRAEFGAFMEQMKELAKEYREKQKKP